MAKRIKNLDRWMRLKKAVFQRDKYTCRYCGLAVYQFSTEDVARLTVDHVIPLSKGGTNKIRNLVTACKACNQSKGDKIRLRLKELKPALEKELESFRKAQ